MNKQKRFVGIDLIRGIAAYGVAILHSGDITTGTSISFWATQVQRFCGFTVPFFLIASFYLSINQIHTNGKTTSLLSRFQRLIIPYLVWSLLYVLMRWIKLVGLQESINTEKITDFVAIVFMGSAGIHLYFIPLIFVGFLFLGIVARLVNRRITLISLSFLFLFSCLADHLVFITGNFFKFGSYIAFENLVAMALPNGNDNPLIRVTLVFIAFAIKCFPYIFAATIVNYILLKGDRLKPNRKILIISFVCFCGLALLGFVGIDLNSPIYLDNRPPIYDVLKATALLVFSIYLSFSLPSSPILRSLGTCTFGIYLMHQALIQILRVPMIRIFPDFVDNVSIPTQLFFASTSFVIAWQVTSQLIKLKIVSRLLFGVKYSKILKKSYL
jgi:surface polysaccharide O-acyltransferase-like enzyme